MKSFSMSREKLYAKAYTANRHISTPTISNMMVKFNGATFLYEVELK